MCIHDWCLQSGTKQQYTKCKRASEDGRTCYNPTIKYGSNVGYPFQSVFTQHKWTYNTWCQQLFPASNNIKGRVSFKKVEQGNPLYWCSQGDESVPHWCDYTDDFWLNQPLGPYIPRVHGAPLPRMIDSLTCLK